MRQVLSTAWQRSQNQKAAEPKARPVPETLAVSEEKTEIVETHSEAPKQETAAPIQRAITSTPVFSQPQPPVQTIDEGLLLEVEPAKNADDDFEWSIDVSEQPVKKAAAVSPRSTVDPDLDFNLHSAPASNMKFVMAGAGALILVVAILGWMFMGGSSKPAEPAYVRPVETQQPAQQEPAPAAAYTDQGAANTATDQAPVITESVTVEAKPESKQAKDKKPAPTPAKSEKKKVTVDDLINDN